MYWGFDMCLAGWGWDGMDGMESKYKEGLG